ncbi:MAG: hypothetical protein ACE5JX_03505 [Acidobacteriota bacterium]
MDTVATAEIDLELNPESRLDVIDVTERIRQRFGDCLLPYRKALYCSYHTTAGYLEQSLCARLNYSRDSVQSFVQSIHRLFPPEADYRHDQLHLRTELSEAQRLEEPRNADSHLTFIGSGLANCVTYLNSPETPVYFIDLDGIYGRTRRQRKTRVIGFTREESVAKTRISVPVSAHPIDAVNLKSLNLGLFEQLRLLLKKHGVENGRIDLALAPNELHAGLTVNEYETLLMKHDLVDVLHNPVRFMAEKGRHMWRDPRAIPSKAINYAKYDLVQVVNEFLDALGLSESFLERIIGKFLAFPASRFLWMKRKVSLLVSEPEGDGRSSIIQGLYQSPILVQWKKANCQTRHLNVTLVRFV